MSPSPAANPRRQLLATVLGAVTALCTLGWFASLGITMLALKTVQSDIPFFPGIIEVIGLAVTLPIALLCTVVSLVLVGVKRSRLAWISLCVYFLPMVCGVGFWAWEHFAKRI